MQTTKRKQTQTIKYLTRIISAMIMPPINYTTGWLKKLAHFVLYALTSSNIDRFSNLFNCQNQDNVCNNSVTKDPTTPQVCSCTIPCEMSVSSKQQLKQDDDFFNNTF